MRVFILFFTLIFSVFFKQCNKLSKPHLDEFMIGSWQTSYIKIKMPTHNGSDTISVYEDSFVTKNAYRAQSTYHDDKTFDAWYLSPKGEQRGKTTGEWTTKGDSLVISYTNNEEYIEVTYFIKQLGNAFSGRSISDWDNDEVEDDTLIMRGNRIELENENR